MTIERQTAQSETTPAASKGDATTPGQSGVATLDHAFSIPFVFRPGGYTLMLAKLAARTGLYKSTILQLIGLLIQHRMLSRLEDGRYQIGATPLMLGALYQCSMRLGNVALSHIRALAEATGEAVSLYIHERDVRVYLHRVDSDHSICDHARGGDVPPLEHGPGGCVLCAFSGMQDATYDATRRDHYYMSISERGRETVGLSMPVFGVQQALRGTLCLAGPASRIGGVLLQSWRVPVLKHAMQIASMLDGDPVPLRLAAQLISRT